MAGVKRDQIVLPDLGVACTLTRVACRDMLVKGYGY